MPNITSDLDALQRQRKMAEALLGQAVSGEGNYASPWSAIGKLALALAAKKQMSEADQGISSYKADQQQKMTDALTGFQDKMTGTPGIPQPPAEFGGGPGRPAQPPDQRAAYATLLNSGVPELQSLGVQQMIAAQKKQEPFTLSPNQRRYDSAGNLIVAAPAEQAPFTMGPGQVRFGPDGKPIASLPEKVNFNAPFLPDGSPNAAFQDYEKGKAQAGATRVQTNVAAYTPASETAQAEFMKSTRATYDALKQAPVVLASIDKAKELIPSAKSFMGPGGEGLLNAAKFLNNRMGLSIKTEGVKSAEELRTRIFFNIMDNLKKMDAQPSQMQQEQMRQALGNLETDPAALPAVLDAFGDVIRGKVALHNQEVQGAMKRGVKFPYDPLVGASSTAGASGGGLTDAEQKELADLRARFGGRK